MIKGSIQFEDILPNKGSELLRAALRDLKAVEGRPDIKVDMNHWWEFTPENVCLVCLVGSVMTQSFGIDARKAQALGIRALGPCLFPGALQFKFYALDALSRGYISRAYEKLGIADGKFRNRPPGIPGEVDIAHYNVNKEKFYSDLEQLADQLEVAGD